MRPSDIMLDFGRPLAYYPGLVKHMGSVNAVVFFGQIFYWQDKASSDDGVYKTAEEIEQETGLSYREQATARSHLKARKLLVETCKRLEHKIFYRIDLDVLDDVIGSVVPEMRFRRSGNDKCAVGEATKAQFVHTENTTEITTETSVVVSADPMEGFDQFWKLYPRKVGKAPAEKAWKKLKVTPELLGLIATALARQSVSIDWLKSGGQYIPYPSKWLNEKRWEDETTTGKPSSFTNLPNHTPDMYQGAENGPAF